MSPNPDINSMLASSDVDDEVIRKPITLTPEMGDEDDGDSSLESLDPRSPKNDRDINTDVADPDGDEVVRRPVVPMVEVGDEDEDDDDRSPKNDRLEEKANDKKKAAKDKTSVMIDPPGEG